MRTILTSTPQVMGRWVAEHAASDLRLAIEKYGSANLVVATGASQFEVLSALVQQPTWIGLVYRAFILMNMWGSPMITPHPFAGT